MGWGYISTIQIEKVKDDEYKDFVAVFGIIKYNEA